MRVGLLGPSDWLNSLETFTEFVDVQWGTDDIRRARELIETGTAVDCVVVHGTADFVTSEVTALSGALAVSVVVLADDDPVNAWLDLVGEVRRIHKISELRETPIATPTVSPISADSGACSGSVVSVWGPVGSPGISTVAISLAALAARDGLSVLLCDADTRGASIAIGLGLIDDVPGFAAACRLAGRKELTAEQIRRLAIPVPVGRGSLSVLTGLPRASRWVEIASPKCRDVVDSCRDMFDLVIIDIGFGIEENEWVDGAPQRDGAARSILLGSDCVVAVGGSDAVGIARLIRGLDELSSLVEAPLVVLNHVTRSSAREAEDAIARFTKHTVAATVSRDSRSGLEDAMTRAPGSAKSVWDAVQISIRNNDVGIER